MLSVSVCCVPSQKDPGPWFYNYSFLQKCLLMALHLVVSVTLKSGHHKEVRGIWRSLVFPLLFFSGLVLTSQVLTSLNVWPISNLLPASAHWWTLHEAHPNLQASAVLVPHISSSTRAQPRGNACTIIFLEISGTMYSQLGTYVQLSRHFKYPPALPLSPPFPIATARLNPRLFPSRPATKAASSLSPWTLGLWSFGPNSLIVHLILANVVQNSWLRCAGTYDGKILPTCGNFYNLCWK